MGGVGKAFFSGMQDAFQKNPVMAAGKIPVLIISEDVFDMQKLIAMKLFDGCASEES